MIRPIHWFAISCMFYVLYLMAGPYALAQAPTATSQGQVDNTGAYVVAPGDTLYGISTRYGLTLAQLVAANTLGSSPTLYVGQRLVMPGATAPSPTLVNARAASPASYTVKSGDTLFSIAQAHEVSVAALAAENALTDATQIFVGQRLDFPGTSSIETAAPVQAARQHEVEAGQTLFSISRLYEIEVDQLAAANSLSGSTQIFVGQVLEIPGANGASVAPTVLALPNVSESDSEVFLGDVATVPVPQTREEGVVAARPSSSPVGAPQEVAVSASPATPIMLPSPPPRRGAKFHWPARGKILTRYGNQSNGQISDGIEIKVNAGSNILAADDGVVAFAGSGVSGYGYLVLIKHADDYYTAYGQNSAVTVARGDIVRRGQLIARAGNATVGINGRLHFEVRYREEPVNPIAYMVN